MTIKTTTITKKELEKLPKKISNTTVDWSQEIEIINYDEGIADPNHEYEIKVFSESAEHILKTQGFTLQSKKMKYFHENTYLLKKLKDTSTGHLGLERGFAVPENEANALLIENEIIVDGIHQYIPCSPTNRDAIVGMTVFKTQNTKGFGFPSYTLEINSKSDRRNSMIHIEDLDKQVKEILDAYYQGIKINLEGFDLTTYNALPLYVQRYFVLHSRRYSDKIMWPGTETEEKIWNYSNNYDFHIKQNKF